MNNLITKEENEILKTFNDFKCIFENIKNDIRSTRFRIVENANSELINLYYRLGKIINDNWKYVTILLMNYQLN